MPKFKIEDFDTQMAEIRERHKQKPIGAPSNPQEKLRQAIQKRKTLRR